MGDPAKQILAKPIQMADQVVKWADGAQSCRHECAEVKSRSERLAALLRQAARAPELYERPARRIMDDTEQVLDKALSLVSKCRPSGLMKRVFIIIPPTAFKKMYTQLDNSIADVSWLLRASSTGADVDGDGDGDDSQLLGLPPIAQNEPILFLIWEHIATLHGGSLDSRSDSAAAIVSLARDNGRYGKLIIEEDGVGHLLRLVREGRVEGQENAARALGLLGRDPESVETILHAGVCSVFAKVLKDGPMRAQAMVAWAVAELAACHPKCQDLFAQNNVVRLLVGHLAFETVEEHSKYSIVPLSNKPLSFHSLVIANKSSNSKSAGEAADNYEDHQFGISTGIQFRSNRDRMHSVVQSTMAARSQNQNGTHPQVQHLSQPIKGRESEDPATKSHMKAMAARALRQLVYDNPVICKSITESKALLCFAVLLEKSPDEEVRHNSAMALMEIARVAEHYSDLRRSAFRPNSPAARAVIDQLLQVVDRADCDRDDNLLLPCITALGCLSRTFRATETRAIAPLVHLLNEKDGAFAREAAIALTKFACTENYLHVEHSRAIVEAGGVEHLVQLAYLEKQVQIEALVLLCYIALHVPESDELAKAGVLAVLAWASKQGHLVQDPRMDSLLPEARCRLELYQSQGSTAFH